MTSSAAYFHSLGDFGGVTVSSDSKSTKLFISSSSGVIFRKIMQEINQVELFFPGLRRQNVYITDSDNIVDETQVLIVGSSVSKACMRIKNALKMRCPDLLVDTQAGRPYTPAKIKCRVAIICVDNRLSDTVQAVSIINSLHEHGITMIPIIFLS